MPFSRTSLKHFFTKILLKRAVQFLFKKSYFTVDNILILQTVDIPMGIYCAPFCGNLYLYNYEFKYIMNLIGTDKSEVDDFTVVFYLFATFVP